MKGSVAIVFLIKMTTGIPIYLKIDRPVYSLVLFQSMTKQYLAVSLTNSMKACLIISFGTAKNLLTFYRHKY